MSRFVTFITFICIIVTCVANVRSDSIAHTNDSVPVAVTYSPQPTFISEVDSINNINKILEETIENKEREIESLKNRIHRLQRESDSLKEFYEGREKELQRNLINSAVNFIYVPYDHIAIDRIAIPSLVAIRGSRYYTEAYNERQIIENYREDIQVMSDFVNELEAKVWEIPYGSIISQKCSEYLTQLTESETYRRYIAYPQWRKTYLGRKIDAVKNILGSEPSEKPNLLTEISTELDNLIRTNSQ